MVPAWGLTMGSTGALLYILQDTTLRHGPLQVIITVNERTVWHLWICLAAEYLDDYLIIWIWEWLGSLCNSTAGCDFIRFTRKTLPQAAPTDYDTLKTEGLQGGHSGVRINLGRANALVCLASAFCDWQADIQDQRVFRRAGQKIRRPPHRRKSWSQKQRPPSGPSLEAYGQDFSIIFGEKRGLLISTLWSLIAPGTTGSGRRDISGPPEALPSQWRRYHERSHWWRIPRIWAC